LRQQHSPVQNKNQNSTNSSATQTELSNMATMNSQIQRPTVASRSQLNMHRNNTGNGGGYRNKRIDDQAQNSTFVNYPPNNNTQWASTSGGMRSQQQNGPRPLRPPFRSGGNDSSGHPRRSAGGQDYWRRNGAGGNGIGASSNNFSHLKDEERGRNNGGGSGGYYHRNNNNDRWQNRNHHPNAPTPLSLEQRRARGPLPDWDEVSTKA
jgi:hypothetical protein